MKEPIINSAENHFLESMKPILNKTISKEEAIQGNSKINFMKKIIPQYFFDENNKFRIIPR